MLCFEEPSKTMESLGLALPYNGSALAETDERLKLVVDVVSGATLVGPREIEITIVDNDRDRLIQASDYGVTPTLDTDQSSALQAALDAAARGGGRGVGVCFGSAQNGLSGITLPYIPIPSSVHFPRFRFRLRLAVQFRRSDRL